MRNSLMVILGLLTLLSFSMIGCGGGGSTKIRTAEAPVKAFEPDGYANIGAPDAQNVYGKGTANSSSRQMAIDKADLIAATDLGAKMERWVQQRDFLREEDAQKYVELNAVESGGEKAEESFKNVRKSIVSTIIKGAEEHFNEVYTEKGKYLVFRVLRMPIGTANKALYDELTRNSVLMRMYKDNAALKELEEDVRLFEEKKKSGK